MTLNPKHLPVPDQLTTADLIIRRQQLDDNDADYAAVMDSRNELRIWSDSDWPEDNFTPEDNRLDLAMHIEEHRRDEAYGFSIFSAEESRFLGSLYINSVAPFIENYFAEPDAVQKLKNVDARVEYWLRQGTDEPSEIGFIHTVQTWLSQAWWFERVAFGSRRNMHMQRQRYAAAGLTELTHLISKDGKRQFHFHTR